MSGLIRVKCVVKGYVQGIGFRYFVRNEAAKLGVAGWVRNAHNGDVEIEAEGSEEILEEFVEAVRSRHPEAHIDEIIVARYPPEGKSQNFEVKF